MGSDTEFRAEYNRMYPDGNAPASLKKIYEAMSLEGNSPAAQNLPGPVAK